MVGMARRQREHEPIRRPMEHWGQEVLGADQDVDLLGFVQRRLHLAESAQSSYKSRVAQVVTFARRCQVQVRSEDVLSDLFDEVSSASGVQAVFN